MSIWWEILGGKFKSMTVNQASGGKISDFYSLMVA